MRPFIENFPFFCIFLCMGTGILLCMVQDGRTAYRISLFVLAAVALMSGILTAYLTVNDYSYLFRMGKFAAPYGNALKVGPLQALLSLVFSLIMGLSIVGGKSDLFHDILPRKLPFYFIMTNLTMASLLTLTYTTDIFTAYVFIEISTIAACAMVMLKESGWNLVATIRYLFMSLMGSGLFLLGVAFLNSITGYLLMQAIADRAQSLVETGAYQVPLTVSIGLITVGLGIKSAMFPFHMWLPDAHGSATTASSAILSGLVLKGYIALLITLFLRAFTLPVAAACHITEVVLAFGLLGMVFGSLGAMREHNIKRMLAYSSVAQVGYIFMGIGMGTEEGMVASCLHVLVHACSKPLLFCCAGRLSAVCGHEKNLALLRGSAHRDRLAGIGFTVGALSMIGIPLLGGFASKLYFASASLSDARRMALILIVIAASTVLNALYYVPALISIWSRNGAEQAAAPAPVDRAFSTAAVCLIVSVIALGIFYEPVTYVIEAGIRLT